jgi:hypothetical protein
MRRRYSTHRSQLTGGFMLGAGIFLGLLFILFVLLVIGFAMN